MEDKSRKEFDEWFEQAFCQEFAHIRDEIRDPIWALFKEGAWAAWQEARKPKVERPSVTWDLELMFKHRGKKVPQFMSLGISTHQDHKEAVADARRRGEVWLDGNFKEAEIESWDVKARPSKSA